MTCGVAAAKRSWRGTVSTTTPSLHPLDRVGDRAPGEGGPVLRRGRDDGRDVGGLDERPGGVVNAEEVVVAGARGAPRGDDRIAARLAARRRRHGHRLEAGEGLGESRFAPRRDRHHGPVDPPGGREPLEGVDQERLPREPDEGLRPRVVEPGTEARRRDERDDGHAIARGCRFPWP